MTTQLRSAQSRAIDQMPGEMNEQPPCAEGIGRLIPLALALYLTPVLLIVLIVGGIGMVVLAVARAFSAIVKGPNSTPLASDRSRGPQV